MRLSLILPLVVVLALVLTGIMTFIGLSNRLSEPVVLQYAISADYSGPISRIKLPPIFRLVIVTGKFDDVGARHGQEFGSPSISISYRTIEQAEEGSSDDVVANMELVTMQLEYGSYDIKKEIVLDRVHWQLRVETDRNMYAFAELGQWRVVVQSREEWTETKAIEFLSGIEWSTEAFRTPEAHASGTP